MYPCLAKDPCLAKVIQKRKRKDPTIKPKGVVSAYSFWLRSGQRKLGEKWTALDSAAKSPYVHMHEEDKKRHIMEMVAYQNAFLIFMKHNRERIMEENACLCLRETSNKCGKEWAALDATELKRYGYEGCNNATDETEKEGNKTI